MTDADGVYRDAGSGREAARIRSSTSPSAPTVTTQSYRAVLDIYKHNIVDVTLQPDASAAATATAAADRHRPVPEPEPAEGEAVGSGHGERGVRSAGRHRSPRRKRVRAACSSRRRSAPDRSTPTATVTGVLTTTRFSTALLIVNGVATSGGARRSRVLDDMRR